MSGGTSADAALKVFATFAVLYLASAAAGWREVGWTAQAASITGAVATYLVMRRHRFALAPSVGIVGAMVVAWVLAGMSAGPGSPHMAHMQVFSVAFLGGAAAYVASVLAAAVGLPVWAALVVSIATVPLFLAYVLPRAAAHIETVFVQQT